MATFTERLRAPLLSSGYADGSETAGETDLLGQAASLALLERMTNMNRGVNSRKLAMRRPQDDWIKRTAIQRRGLPAGVENVVYDQRPEQFAKELALKNREIDAKLSMAETLNAIRQQNADTAAQRADAYEFGVRNPAGRVVSSRGGNYNLINPRTGAAVDTGVATGTMTQEDELEARAADVLAREAARIQGQKDLETQRQGGRVDLARMAHENRLVQNAASEKARDNRQNDAQEFRANQPRERTAAINQRARDVANANPEYAANIEFDDRGNFRFKDGVSDDMRRKINKEIYGERRGDINLGKGSDASSLSPTPGAASVVPMVFPDGTTRNVPANRVQAAEAAGAKRR